MMETISQAPVGFLLVLLKCTVVIALAGLLVRRLGDASPVLRHRLWSIALAIVMVFPLIPAGPVAIELPGMTGRFWQFVPENEDAGSPPRFSTVRARASETLPMFGPAATSGAAPFRGGHVQAVPPGSSESEGAVPWARLIALVYLTGAASVGAWIVVGFWATRRLHRRARPLPMQSRWAGTVGRVLGDAEANGLFWVSDSVSTPVTFGSVRPRILLPVEGVSWSESQRESAILHEISHVKRRDFSFQVLGWTACALYWFHPLVWRAASELRREAELACDAAVLHAGVDPLDYADQLLELTRFGQMGSGYLGIAGRSLIAHRVRCILDGAIAASGRPRRFALAPLLIASTVLGLVGSNDPTRADWVNEYTPPIPPALYQAIIDSDVQTVRELIVSGADVNQRIDTQRPRQRRRDENGARPAVWDDEVLRTPLATAARVGGAEIAALLLDAGAVVDAAPNGDATALMVAAEHGHAGMVTLLLEHGAEVNRRIRGDGTALIAGVRGGDLSIVRALVDAGADVNLGVSGDGNPLITSVAEGRYEMVRFLVHHGADPWATVEGDESAVVTAAEAGDETILRLLMSASNDR